MIAAGADGNLWFTDEGTTPAIGRITPAGAITEFDAGATSTPWAIAAGTDGNVWFTDPSKPSIGRITAGPGVATREASGVTSSEATLNGSVRPNSQLTAFRFQYGTDTGYGSETSAQVAGQDASQHPVSAALSGLSPSTTYHYRLTANNDSDTTVGEDRTLTTAAADDAGGGGGGGLGGAPALPPIPPAKASFADSRASITVSRTRRFRFSFRATPGLAGTAILESVNKVRVSRRRKVALTRKSFTVPPSGKVALRIRLSKRTFRILKRNRRILTRATVTLKDAVGLTSTASKRITLTAPRRPRRRH